MNGVDERVRIVIADDHAVVRQAIASLLDGQPDFRVIGQAADGRDAVEQVQRLCPDVAILDWSMPHLDGVQAAERISSSCPGVKVIGLSMYDGTVVESAMREAGAVAHVEKCGPVERLFCAIRDAAK